MSERNINLESEKETQRIEAFSDGVFAIAITLLILELKVPKPSELGGESLGHFLWAEWPSYFAFLLAFFTILIMWYNHHKLFTHIHRTDRMLAYTNGLLLLFICVTPFPTALMAEYVGQPEERTAAIVFGGFYFLLAVAYNILWRYAASQSRLLGPNVDMEEVHRITKQYLAGPIGYGVSFIFAFFSTPACLIINLSLAIFFAFTGSDLSMITKRRREKN